MVKLTAYSDMHVDKFTYPVYSAPPFGDELGCQLPFVQHIFPFLDDRIRT
jgi:hypothetical protein